MFVSQLGIDFGTANMYICVQGKGVVLNEPTAAAYDRRTGEICAMGSAAHEMLGRTPEGVGMIYPLQQGVIADYKIAGKMLKYFIKKAVGNRLRKPVTALCVPVGATEVEKRAVWDAAFGAGANRIQLIESPIAAALGAGLDISRPKGHLLVDIGAGITNVAVISMNNIVLGQSVKTGGNDFDQALIDYIRNKYRLLIGQATAEHLKKTVGSVFAGNDKEEVKVSGRSQVTGMPEMIIFSSAEAREAMRVPADKITEGVRRILEQTPPELAVDISENSIMLTGGTAQLDGFDRLIESVSGIHTVVAENPAAVAAMGAAMYAKVMNKASKAMKVGNNGKKRYEKFAQVETNIHSDAGVYISGREVPESH